MLVVVADLYLLQLAVVLVVMEVAELEQIALQAALAQQVQQTEEAVVEAGLLLVDQVAMVVAEL